MTTTTGSHGDVVLDANDSATVTAVSHTKIIASDTSTLGVVVVFNTVGWQATNVLFQTIDALLGSDYLSVEEPAAATAYVSLTPVSADGGLSVTAENKAQITATAGEESTSNVVNTLAFDAKFGASSMAAGGILASN